MFYNEYSITRIVMKNNNIIPIIIFSFLSLVLVILIYTTGSKKEAQSAQEEPANETGIAHNTALRDELPETELENFLLYYDVYTVKSGDVVGKIAEKHGISQDAIISVNKLRNTRILQIGQLLKIPSMDGIVYTVKEGDTLETLAEVYKISVKKLSLVNKHVKDVLKSGTVVFLPDAKLDWHTLQEINGDLFKSPIKGNYRITSRYGWRNDPFTGGRSFHNGIDLAIGRGTPVYASLAGTVITTGFSTVYGNYIIVRHHSGYQTLYGHLSSILTYTGSHVTNNTCIGTVGTTGRSTGPHLHFTVYKNGATINPTSVWN